MTRWMLMAALAFPLVACGGEEEAAEAANELAAALEQAAEEVEAEIEEAEPTEEEVPIPEDFAEEAEAEITAENYVSVLDELEAELEADSE